jgi:tetratricopeptide (TPR) repeat protein
LEAEVGAYATAEAMLEQAIRSLEPPDKADARQVAILARAYNNQGYTFSQLGRRQRSIAAYSKALPAKLCRSGVH